MGLYAPQSLQEKDVVMVEALIARYKIQDDDDKGKGSSPTVKTKSKTTRWDKWRAHLELKAVSLIAKAPEESKDEADATCETLI